MAKITTITNPLTGQPAQVDQLDHTAQEIDDAIARALPGGEIDITLQQITGATNAAEYSATATYAIGDYCTHDGKLYRCTTAITEPEAWTEAHWTETTVGAELTAIYTALQNNDPRQWGLGDVGKAITDCNSATESGIYRFDTADNSPFAYATMLVLERYGGGICTQIAFCNAGVDIGVIAIRNNNEVWEYINPPMQLGVEYRTTERYLGKPVYVICTPMGACAASSEKVASVGLSNVGYIIDCIGTADNIFALPHLHGVPGSADFNAYSIMCWAQKTGGDNISAGYACGSSRPVTDANLIIKYTKTTD